MTDRVNKWHENFEKLQITEYKLKKSKKKTKIAVGCVIGLGIAATAATGGALAPVVVAEVGALGVAAGAAAGAGAGGVLTGFGAAGRRLYRKLAKPKPGSEETQQKDQEFDNLGFDQSVAHSSDTCSAASAVENQEVENQKVDDQEVEDPDSVPLLQ